MIIPDINDKLVKYSCFNVFGVYFKTKNIQGYPKHQKINALITQTSQENNNLKRLKTKKGRA